MPASPPRVASRSGGGIGAVKEEGEVTATGAGGKEESGMKKVSI